jgi:hypothetical protein
MPNYNHTWLREEWERMGRPEVDRYSTAREGWEKDENPKFIVHFQYRIKSKPHIDWEHVSKEYKWMSCNLSHKGTRLYKYKPHNNGYGWSSTEGDGIRAEYYSSFSPCTCAWNDSLVKRPTVKRK